MMVLKFGIAQATPGWDAHLPRAKGENAAAAQASDSVD